MYTPEDTTIQTPNSDTPYSSVGADLRTEPLVLTVPPIEQDRYYSLQFVDGYTYNFAYVGSRTTGNGGGKYLLAGPNWKGEKPEGVDEVIRSDTDLAFVLYRTQLFGPSDIEKVKKIQAGYQVTPLSAFLNQPPPTPAPADRLRATADSRSAAHLAAVLRDPQLRPAVRPDAARRSRAARPVRQASASAATGGFDADKLSPEMRPAIEAGMADAWAEFDALKKEKVDTGKVGLRAVLRHRRRSQGQLSVPDGRRGARHLRQHRRRGYLPELLQRRRAARR